MINITLTIAATPEVAGLLSSLLSILGKGSIAPKAAVPAPVETKQDATNSDAISIKPEIAATTTTVAQTEPITLELLREATTAKVKSGKRDAVKNLLDKYGAKNIASLDKQKFLDFKNELDQL